MINFYRALNGKMFLSLAWFTFLFISSIALMAQNVSIKGKVTDADTKEPLPGTNILLKGTNVGTTTDLNGEYTINAPADGILIISFIGYKTQEINVGSRTLISTELSLDAETLSEVVVIGYGTIEKKDATGSLVNISTKEFNKGLVTSPDQLINGKVAGLQIASNGDPGGGAAIRLRGSSINGQTPLFVVDGVVLAEEGGGVVGGRNPLNFINPSDIENVTVLKDAQATAIYGARGANGVILITTKSGKAGKPQFSYDGFASVSFFSRKPDFLSPAEFRQAIVAKAPQKLDELGDANTDWLDEVTRPALSTQHTISVSGGIDKTLYRASINFLHNQGVLLKTDHTRVNFQAQVIQKLLDDKLTLTLNTKNGITRDQFGAGVLSAAASFDPTRSVYDANNVASGGFFQWESNTNATGNPVAQIEQTSNKGRTYRNLTSLAIKYEIPFIKGLSFNANLAYDYNKGRNVYTQSALSRDSRINGWGNIYSRPTTVRKNQLYEYFGNYSKTLGKHKFDLTAGYAWQNFRLENELVYSDESDRLDPVVDEPYVENRLISFFGRATYDFGGKYLLAGSLRRDGSTRFGPDNRWGLFPAASVAWRILEESFAAPLTNVFTELKFRASYGVTGNEQIRDYQYATYYRPNLPGAAYQFGDQYVSTLTPNGADKGLKWEENISSNIALDASILEGRFTFTIDYYRRDVRDLIFTISPPAGSVPDDQLTTNIGNVTNRGIELTTNVVAIDKKDLKWNFSFNASYNVNEIVKLDNLQGDDLADFPGYRTGGIEGDIGRQIQIRKVGLPIDAFFVYKHKRNPDGSLVLDTNGDGIQSKIEMYEDINGDGIINEKDLVAYRQPQPKVLIGFTSNLTYKKWDLALTLRGSFGNYVYNNLASANGVFERLSIPVINNIHASAFETGFKNRQSENVFSDYYVQNASFLKVDNITLGYNFGKISEFNFLRAYVTAQNPLIITPYDGIEPETFGGIENNPYPRSTTITLGINATF